jgi:hypothetical protein
MRGFINFWWREGVGWLLIVLGLLAFYESWRMVRPAKSGYQKVDTADGPMMVPVWQDYPQIFEAPVVVVIGIFLFRGGIQMLKVAVAARIYQQAAKQLDTTARKPAPPLARPPRVGAA